MLIIVGKETTRACGTDQLCSGLGTGIEGGIHHMRLLWDEHDKEKDDTWGVLLIDTKNVFNEGNRKMMMLVAKYEWPFGSHFLLNNYRNHSGLAMRGEFKKNVFIHSKKGQTQGCSLAILEYGILLLPLIRRIKREFTSIDSPCYADDGAAIGRLRDILILFRRLCELGSAYEYLPEENKSILIVRSRDNINAEDFRSESDSNFKITNGFRYLGSLMGKKIGDRMGRRKKKGLDNGSRASSGID